jgi:hypothetical protein
MVEVRMSCDTVGENQSAVSTIIRAVSKTGLCHSDVTSSWFASKVFGSNLNGKSKTNLSISRKHGQEKMGQAPLMGWHTAPLF